MTGSYNLIARPMNWRSSSRSRRRHESAVQLKLHREHVQPWVSHSLHINYV